MKMWCVCFDGTKRNLGGCRIIGIFKNKENAYSFLNSEMEKTSSYIDCYSLNCVETDLFEKEDEKR